MALKQCDKCSEMVDEAKAFCPGCGNALVVEEARKKVSNFDTMDSTVQLGQTMYNQMLSDMGLNTAKAPTPIPPEKRVEIIAPVAVPVMPAAPPPAPAPVKVPESPKPSGNLKWFILAGVVMVVIAMGVVVVAVGIYFYMSRFR